MNLIENIKVINKHNNENNIMINTGVYKPSVDYNEGGIYYLEEAFIPKSDWRIPNKENIDKLLKNLTNINYGEVVLHGKIPYNIEKLFKSINIQNSKDKKDALNKLFENQKILFEIEENIFKYLKKYNKEGDFELYKVLVLYPDRLTAGLINFEDDTKFIGLHFDSSTSFEIETAQFSKNRFCLNLGLENRELYFINLSLIKIKKLILEKNNLEQLNLRNLTQTFFKYYPNYPVLKLIIKPFEYYIAPTDNIIHDGTTINKKEMDISITYLGQFKNLI